jgi:FkbM family methyltransferase
MADFDFSKDPIFSQFPRWHGRARAGFDVNFLYQKTDVSFVAGWATEERSKDRDARPSYPAASEETFEWLSLLTSVLEAGDSFNMIELGAGYGRWVVAGACALRQKRPSLPFRLMAVEGDPTHFDFMKKHFVDNDLDPSQHLLIHAAVSDKDGTVIFTCADNPSEHWGQLIIEKPEHADRWGCVPVPGFRSYALATLLEEFSIVDLIDMDVQGSELSVVAACPAELNAKVRRLHIGTHGPMLEDGLRDFFNELGWSCQYDFGNAMWPNNGPRVETPYGSISFQDGVQAWINPRLSSRAVKQDARNWLAGAMHWVNRSGWRLLSSDRSAPDSRRG